MDYLDVYELQRLQELQERYIRFEERLARTYPWGTYLLASLCVLIFIWVSFSGGTTNTFTLLRFGASYKPLFLAGEWWRLIGPLFLHIGFLHLFMNMYILLDVGKNLEQYFGNIKYLALYFIAGIFGSLVSITFGNHVSAGASGAIFGLCGAAAWVGYRYREEIPEPSRNRLAGGMAIFILYNLAFGFMRPGIDNAAHIGGLIAGALFAMIVPPIISDRPDWSRSIPAKALFTIIAFVPFLVEGFVISRAVSVPAESLYPLVEYTTQDKEYSVKYPSFFKVQERKKNVLFSGPGMGVELSIIDLDEEINIETLKDVEIKELQKRGEFKVANQQIVAISGRQWLLIEGTSVVPRGHRKVEVQSQMAFTSLGNRVIRFTLAVASKEEFPEGKKVLRVLLDSFREIKTQ